MEKWKHIPGWEKIYQVSSLGRVRSLDRKVFIKNPWGKFQNRFYKGRVLKPGVNVKSKYEWVSLTHPGKKFTRAYVHDLVLAAFKGPKPKGMECCHRNGKRSDCRLANLRYGTRSSNQMDRRKHGTMNQPKGVACSNAKLTLKDVAWIRRNTSIKTQRYMAAVLGVSHNTVGAVLRFESYK